jgi:hypothetical protein
MLSAGSVTASAGGTVVVPIYLDAVGGEQGIGLSLEWPADQLALVSATTGSGMQSASLTSNTLYTESGRWGGVLLLPSGAPLSLGRHEVARLSFTVAPTAPDVVGLAFADAPVTRQVVDASSVALTSLWTSGEVVLVAFESDASPRSAGSGTGSITVSDVVQVCRFVAGVDVPIRGGELQRADTAPRDTRGDGTLTTADCVQAQRDAVGLDAVRIIGGPRGQSAAPVQIDAHPTFLPRETTAGGSSPTTGGDDTGRRVQLMSVVGSPGSTLTMPVRLVALGTENGLGFSVQFDPTLLVYQSATLGSGATGATLMLNETMRLSGRVGILLTRPIGSTFSTGDHEVVRLNFSLTGQAGTVSMVDMPVAREIASVSADTLPAVFGDGVVGSIAPGLTVSPGNWTVPPGGGTQAITVSSTVPGTRWTVESSGDWVRMTPLFSYGSGSITLSATANPSSVSGRRAQIMVAGNPVTISQAPATATFAVSSTAWTAPASGGVLTLQVSSSHDDAPWTVVNTADWIALTRSESTGSGAVALTAVPNPGLAVRSATIVVAGRPVTVTQAPRDDRPLALTVERIEGNQVTLRWQWLGAPPDSYVLAGGLTPDETLAKMSTGISAPKFTFEAPTGAFYVRVAGVRRGIELPFSDNVRIFVNVPQSPSAPTSLLGLANGSSLDLTWTNTAAGGPPTELALDVTGTINTTVSLPVTERFSFPTVPDGTFTFRVRAINNEGSSGPSDAVTLTFPGVCAVPGRPEALQAYVVGSLLSLNWNGPSTGSAPTRYILMVSGRMSGTLSLVERSISAPVPAGTYTFTVAAENACGVGLATAEQTVVVP